MQPLVKLVIPVLCFFVAAFIILKKARQEDRIKYLLLTAVLTAICSFINYKATDELQFFSVVPSDTVTITALDEKNDASKEKSVYLSGVFVDMASGWQLVQMVQQSQQSLCFRYDTEHFCFSPCRDKPLSDILGQCLERNRFHNLSR